MIYRLHKYRNRFTSILSSSTYANKSRFMRLFLLAVILLIVFLPASVYTFFLNISDEFLPYSWADIHGEGWLSIEKIPTGNVIKFDRWPPVGVGFLVFLLFGLGKDAVALYRDWINTIGIGRFLPDRLMARENLHARAFSIPGSTQDSTGSKGKAVDLYAPLPPPPPFPSNSNLTYPSTEPQPSPPTTTVTTPSGPHHTSRQYGKTLVHGQTTSFPVLRGGIAAYGRQRSLAPWVYFT